MRNSTLTQGLRKLPFQPAGSRVSPLGPVGKKMPLRWYDTTAPWNDCRPHPKIYNQYYGRGLRLNDLPRPHLGHLRSGYLQPWLHHATQHGAKSEIAVGKDCFHVAVDVQHFEPRDIVVRIVDDQLIVEAKHEEQADVHGYITRHFIRRYHIPKDVLVKSMECNLSSDGVLIITAAKSAPLEDELFRSIPINKTGIPAVRQLDGFAMHPGHLPPAITTMPPSFPLPTTFEGKTAPEASSKTSDQEVKKAKPSVEEATPTTMLNGQEATPKSSTDQAMIE
ncbi:hypothetical protein J437_LFUL012990 [Ladona fulva]|uniref:SHSP domain-containing protein n=1 Tax=Ladona fulva TaxID=123851 RepID=A0A8K0P1W9_LADFU|nr:hypothetical protein J437_LFUL012990 [Ladona fulva]